MTESTNSWATGLFTMALVTFGVISLAAVFGPRSKRAAYAGFASFGWCYLALAFGPWFRDAVRPHLPTTRAIENFPCVEILPCPDDNTMTPTSLNLSYSVSGFRMWPGYGNPAITIPTISSRERIGHSLFAFIMANLGTIVARCLILRRLANAPPPVAA